MKIAVSDEKISHPSSEERAQHPRRDTAREPAMFGALPAHRVDDAVDPLVPVIVRHLVAEKHVVRDVFLRFRCGHRQIILGPRLVGIAQTAR